MSKPDRDNAEKAILDSLKGVVFLDDAQVCDGVVQKMYHAGDESPGVHVEIEEIV
jgi:Holliday junction resolvase RusA-like endonuclease